MKYHKKWKTVNCFYIEKLVETCYITECAEDEESGGKERKFKSKRKKSLKETRRPSALKEVSWSTIFNNLATWKTHHFFSYVSLFIKIMWIRASLYQRTKVLDLVPRRNSWQCLFQWQIVKSATCNLVFFVSLSWYWHWIGFLYEGDTIWELRHLQVTCTFTYPDRFVRDCCVLYVKENCHHNLVIKWLYKSKG